MKKNYDTLRNYLSIYFDNQLDEFGDTYPQIVETSVKLDAPTCLLIHDLDDLLLNYPDNRTLTQKLDQLMGCSEYAKRFPPTPLVFFTWLSAYLKELAQQ